MALFFDTVWFDARLQAVHLSRADLAAALGLTPEQVGEIWKDQRELSARDVAVLAGLLGVSPGDVAHRAGISTPVPALEKSATQPVTQDAAIRALSERLERVEQTLRELMATLGKPGS